MKKLTMKRQTVTHILKAICFLLVFALLLHVVSNIVTPKSNHEKSGIKNYQGRGFYAEPQNSLDVVGIGNSDLYSSISPMQLFEQHGIASYMCGEATQRVYNAYFLLKEVLATQTPKLLIFETDEIYQWLGNSVSDKGDKVISDTIGYVFPVIEYHNRWKWLKWEDFIKSPRYTWRSKIKGYVMSNKIQPYTGGEYMHPTEDRQEIDGVVQLYLEKIIDLCKEKDVPILFVQNPSPNSWNYAKHNAVSDFAQEHEIAFLDLNEHIEELNINWDIDTKDKGHHLNFYGAMKVTNYIGEYLKQHYNLPDRREDPAYTQWQTDLEDYRRLIQSRS